MGVPGQEKDAPSLTEMVGQPPARPPRHAPRVNARGAGKGCSHVSPGLQGSELSGFTSPDDWQSTRRFLARRVSPAAHLSGFQAAAWDWASCQPYITQ